MTESVRSASVALQRELGRRPRTRYEAQKWLQQRGVGADDVENLLSELQDAGLIDDARFALLWIEDRHQRKGYGPRRLERELRERGIADEHLSVALESIFGDREELKVRLRELAAEKFPALFSSENPRDGQKLRERLLRFGYDSSLIQDSLRGRLLDPSEMEW